MKVSLIPEWECATSAFLDRDGKITCTEMEGTEPDWRIVGELLVHKIRSGMGEEVMSTIRQMALICAEMRGKEKKNGKRPE